MDLLVRHRHSRIKNINIHWQPRIGDPTLVGWVTVFAYFLTALICAVAALRVPARSAQTPANAKKESHFWAVATVLMLSLGFNKQLDFQTLFTELGRYYARSGHWYDQRHQVQILFIAGLSVTAVTTGVTMFWLLRKTAAAVRLASIGLCFLGTFVVARAASFHDVDQFLGESISGLRYNGILELGGISIVAAAGLRYQKNRPPRN